MADFDAVGLLYANEESNVFDWELPVNTMALWKHGYMVSPQLEVLNDEDKTFQFELHKSHVLRRGDADTTDTVRLILCYLNGTPITCMYNIAIVKDDEVMDLQTDHLTFSTNYSERQILNVLPDVLYENASAAGNLRIRCQFTFPLRGVDKMPDFDFEWIFLNESLSDVRLRTADGKTIPAHSIVLGGASPVFRAMFSQNASSQNQSTTIDMDEVGYDAAVEMLRYIYTGRIQIDGFSSASLLLATANKYQLAELKEDCENILVSCLSTGNVMEALVMADTFNAGQLMKGAVHFVRDKINGELKVNEICDMLINKLQMKIE